MRELADRLGEKPADGPGGGAAAGAGPGAGARGGAAGRVVVVGAIGEAASPETVLLMSMRLNCRGVRTVNLGAGLTLAEAADAMERHHGAEALLLMGDAGTCQASHLARLAERLGAGRAGGEGGEGRAAGEDDARRAVRVA